MLSANRTENNGEARWTLKLYVSGGSPKSSAAMRNISNLCQELLPGKFDLEVIDICENPSIGDKEHILALPMLVRLYPAPVRRIIGDLSDPETTAVALNLKTRKR
jgi:circadian clock protein KaiB